MSSVQLRVVSLARPSAIEVARFALLVRAHEAALFAFALRLSRDQAEARDLVQDTLERGLRGFASFTAGSNARAWLCTILYNLFIDRARHRKLEAVRPLHEHDLPVEEAAPPPWAAITPEQLRAALERLDPEFREVCQLRVFARLSYADIAARLAISRNTVATRLMRGRHKLKALLQLELEEQP